MKSTYKQDKEEITAGPFDDITKEGGGEQFAFTKKEDNYNTNTDERLELLSEVDSQGEKIPEWKKKRPFSRKHYAWIALASGFFFGNQVFLMQVVVHSQLSKLSFVIFFPVFMGYLFTSSIYQTKIALEHKKLHGTYWSLKTSAYFYSDEAVPLSDHQDSKLIQESQSKGKIRVKWFNLLGVLGKATVTLCSQFFKISVMYTASRAGFNYSLAINLYSLTPFITAVLFYFFFKERLQKMHLIGMGLLFVCILITGHSAQKHTNSATDNGLDPSQQLSVMVPITLALCTTLIYATNSVVGRYVVSNGTVTAPQMMADAYLLLTVIFFTIFISCENPFPASVIFSVGGISILGATAAFLITEAVVYGKAGPAHALTEVQSLYVLILEVLVLGKIPNTLQMVGFVFGFIGGAFIAFESKKDGETKYVPLAAKDEHEVTKKD